MFAFHEVFNQSLSLHLGMGMEVGLPCVPGYAALKLSAWSDRAEDGEYRDASDIATTIYWYSESESIEQRLYGTDLGVTVLQEYEMDRVLVRRTCWAKTSPT